MFSFLVSVSLLALTKAMSRASSSGNCVGTISSLDDVSTAVQCNTVNIQEFTVPAGRTFSLNLLDQTTVNVDGNITFGVENWKGPLLVISGNDITFNGNGMTWDGSGNSYWDGQGLRGGVTKPDPMMSIQMSGKISDVRILNSPARALAVSNSGPLDISFVTVDNGEGNYPNDQSNGLVAGTNTDAFDVTGNNVVIKHCVVHNQDDCLAINSGQDISFEYNFCSGGHGISIGSINSDVVVKNVLIQGNQVVNSLQAFRIKTVKSATNSRVTNITYVGNTAQNCSEYGIVIDQSYPYNLEEPGDGVEITNVRFVSSETVVDVVDGGYSVAINCGTNTCTGVWDWSYLKDGGKLGKIKNAPTVSGYTL